MNPLPSAWLRALAAASVFLLAGCATVPPRNAELEDARSAFAQARGHPFAQQATAELERAQQSLAQAEAGWSASKDAEATNQRAYLARRQAEIALAAATQAGNEQRLAQAAQERERLLLLLHTRAAGAAAPQRLFSDAPGRPARR